RVVRFGGTDIDPGGRADLRFSCAVAPTTPARTHLVFRATVITRDCAPLQVVSSPLVVGWPVGDVNRNGLVDVRDLVAFILGWRRSHAGQYQAQCDVAPVVGSWPDDVSQADGRVDSLDAAAMLDALLRWTAP
ncbi:MAG: hypothetical protein H5T86_14630, partial [Armatimonadetes bacterium]|nr:hypothetical protein [Armatimonadota bacterium]